MNPTSTASVPRGLCATALCCAGLAALVLILPTPQLLRGAVVLGFCCWAPGVAIFAIFKAWSLVRSPAATIITSLSLVILLSQMALAVHLWSPVVQAGTLAVACSASLIYAVLPSRPASDG